MKSIRSMLLVVLALQVQGCQLPTQERTEASDRLKLLRSMIYTQQQLINDFIVGQSDRQAPGHLIHAYCDLVKKDVPPFNADARACPPPGNQGQDDCMEHFYQCMGSCRTKSGECKDCEELFATCMRAADTSS